MENIFNENANAKTKYLDHLYCHTNESKTVMRTNHKYNNNVNKTMNAADVEFVLKENKQLKSMLLLHLDLIQQQAEELSVKERELMTRTEECDKLRAFNAQLEAKVVDLQRQLQRQIKRTVVKRTFLPPPPLAKIQCHNENVTNVTLPAKIVRVSSNDDAAATTTITNANNAKINSATVNSLKCSPANAVAITAPIAATSKLIPALEKIEIKHEQNVNATKNAASSNCELDAQELEENPATAIKVERNAEENQDAKDLQMQNSTHQSAAESTKQVESVIAVKVETELKLDAKLKHASEINFFSNIHSSTSCSSPCSTNTLRTSLTSCSTNSSKRRRLWQASDFESDEDSMSSYDSLLDIETNSNTCASPLPSESCDSSMDCCQETDCSMSSSCSSESSSTSASDAESSKHNFMYHIVTSPYLSRPWQEEELDGELEEDEAEALRAAEPKLEIPKWTEHEITPLYSIEGTEDLTDDTFSKRHSKLELDEKRRKKWDVQQIREQRRIEKLRRRHCKDELAQGPIIQSFFPLAEELETICFVETLPVQAFGEPIPKLSNNGEGFRLPWIVESPGRTVRIPKSVQKAENASKNETDIENENLEYNENKENEDETKCENKEETKELVENKTIKAKDEERVSTKDDEEIVLENTQINYNESNDETKNNNVNTEDDQQEKCSNTTIREAISLDDDNSNSSNVDDSCDNNSKMDDSPFRFAAIAGSCYHSPVIMLAKHTKQCASRTQMRKRLRYSSFLFLTKRRRQLSMSTIAQATNNAQITVNTATSVATDVSNINTVALCTTPITSTEITTTSTTTITSTTTTTVAINNIAKTETKLNEQKATIAIKTRSMQPSTTRKITRALITAQNKAIVSTDKSVSEKKTLEIATPTIDNSTTNVTDEAKSNITTTVTASSINITSSTVNSVAPISTAVVVKPTTRSFEKRTIDDNKNVSKSLTNAIETTTATTATTIAATTTNATRSKLRAFRVATSTSSINNSNSCTTITTSLASIEEKTKSK